MAVTDVKKGMELMNPALFDPPAPDLSTEPVPVTSMPPEVELRKGKV